MKTCSICNQPVTDQSTDIEVHETWYEKNGEVHETGISATYTPDYIVVCMRSKCRKVLSIAWATLTSTWPEDSPGDKV